jgi:hypothetical protein
MGKRFGVGGASSELQGSCVFMRTFRLCLLLRFTMSFAIWQPVII